MAIKMGSMVEWTSQSAGYDKTKHGEVVVVMKKNTDYTAGNQLPQRLFVDILRNEGMTRDEARKMCIGASYMLLTIILGKKYKVRFRLVEGMNREEAHYLIEVEDDERKPYLYHPRMGETFRVI